MYRTAKRDITKAGEYPTYSRPTWGLKESLIIISQNKISDRLLLKCIEN
jgi:hypothetical protein